MPFASAEQAVLLSGGL